MHNRWSRSARWLVVAMLLSLVIVPGAAAEKIKLQFAMWIAASSPGEVEAQQRLIDQYEEMNPHVEIELFYQEFGGYHEKMYTMAIANMLPDVMTVSRIYIPSFVEQGLIQPIDPWLDKEPISFVDNILELVSGTYQGSVYGIPIWGGPMIAEYNADLFVEAGLVEPIDLEKSGQWTWDIFADYGKKITKDINGDGTRDVFMHAKLGTAHKDWYIKLRGFGGDVVTADGKPFTDVGAVERGLEYFASLAHEHRITPLDGESSGFIAGTEAVYFSWISSAPTHHERVNGAFRAEIVPPPSGPVESFNLVGGVPITVSATTPHAEEAYKFARWYAMESGHWKLRGTPPGRDEMLTEYRAYLGTMFSWPEAVVEAMSRRVSSEPGIGPHYDDLNAGWNAVIREVAAGNISPREGAVRLIEHTEKTLNQ